MTNQQTKTVSVPQLCYDVRGNSLRFRVKYANQESTFRATGIKLLPHEVWNKKTRAIDGSEAKTFTIKDYDIELDCIYLKTKGLDQPVTAVLLLDYLTKTRDMVNDRPNLVAAMDSYIATKRTEFDNGNITRSTFRRYEVRRAYTIEFLQLQYKVSNIELDELKPVIGKEYESFLRNVKKLGVSTVNKDVEFLKAVLDYAILNEQTHRNVLSHWKRGKVTTEIRFLTHHEVNAIRNLSIHESTLNSVRWIFVFSCHTGMSHKDLQLLKTHHLLTDSDGLFYIQKKRNKSGQEQTIALSKTALEIIEQFRGHANKTDFLLPTLSLDKYNGYLTALQSLTDIRRVKLSSKLGRSTFSTVLQNNGVTAEILKNATGHADTKTLQRHYAKVHENTTRAMVLKGLEIYD